MEILQVLIGEVLGDCAFFLTIYPDRNIAPMTGRDRRNYLFFPMFSFLFSFESISVMYLSQLAIRMVYLTLKPFSPFLETVKELIHYVADIFPQTSSMFCYMLLYIIIRNNTSEKIVHLGKGFMESHDNFGKIYVRDELSNDYVLSPKWKSIVFVLKLFIAINLICLTILHTGVMNIQNVLFFRPLELIPVVCVTALFEAVNYLDNGFCARWKWLKKGDAKVTLNMSLRRIRAACIRAAAKDKSVVLFDSSRSHRFEFRDEVQKIIKSYEEFEDARIQYLLSYLKRESSGLFYHVSCVETAVMLVQGKSIFYATPFYYDVGLCIFFPMYLSLLRKEKAIILIEDTGNLNEILEWVKKGIEDIQDLVDFWNVDLLDGNVDQTDVGILPFQIINQQDKVYWLDEFLEKVSFAAILEASDILAGGQESVAAFAEKVGKKTPKCTWFLCDKNAESMIDLFSHLLNAEINYVSATPYYAQKSIIAYWNTESEPPSPWKPANRYLGIEARIAEIAGKEQVAHLIWYGEDVMAIYDLQWIFGQYYDLYGKRTGEKPYQMQINNHISYEISGNANKLEEEHFLIVEDYCCNLFEIGRQFATRAQQKIFVHILSPNYMLRDYMKSIKDVMNADPKYITQFVPLPVNTMRNVALRLIRRMLESEVSEDEIWELLKKSEDKVEREFINLRYLQKLINLFFNIQDAEISIRFKNKFSNQEKEFKQLIYYRIIDERVEKEFRKYFSQAVYIDEAGNRKYIGKLMLAGHLDQKYMKGQQVALNGKNYVITGKNQSDYGQELIVRRASDQIIGRKYYRQLRRYFSYEEQDGITIQTVVFQSHQIVLKRCHLNLKAYSYGYLEMDGWNHIHSGNRVLNEFEEEREREYKGKEALQIEFAGSTDIDRLVCWTAVILKETFCTFYPQYCHLLDVAVNYIEYQECEFPQELLSAILSHIDANTPHSFYILEDSREDMGLLRSIESNFLKIIKIIQDYVKWSKENGDTYFEN